MPGKPSAAMGFVQCVNIIMGTGGLALPFAFYGAGYILAPVVMALSAFSACVTICWHFEGQLRAYLAMVAFERGLIFVVPANQQAAARAIRRATSGDSNPLLGIEEADDKTGGLGELLNATDESGPVVFVSENAAASGMRGDLHGVASLREAMALCNGAFDVEAKHCPDSPVDLDVDFENCEPQMFLEVCDLLAIFGGRRAVYLWNFALVAYVMTTMWVYTVVLAETFLLGIPLAGFTSRLECNTARAHQFADNSHCTSAIRFLSAGFSMLLGFLVMRDWKFLPLLQQILTFCMYVILAIMTATCLVGLSKHPFPGAPTQEASSSGAFAQHNKPFKMSGFANLFGTSIFAMVCHTGSTFIIRHMPSNALTKPVFRASMTAVGIIYTAMSLSVAFYVGGSVDKLSTLTWANYGEWGFHNPSSVIANIIGNFVLFFPLFSVTAAYIGTLRSGTDAMEFMIPLEWRIRFCSKFGRRYVPCGSPVGFSVWPLQVSLRLGTVAVGMILSLISYQFQAALSVASLLGFVVLFFVPLIVQFQSRRTLGRLGIQPTTKFDDFLSGNVAAAVFFVMAIAASVYFVLSQLLPTVFSVHIL